MTLKDIAEFATETTGDISSDAIDYAKKAAVAIQNEDPATANPRWPK